MKRLWKSALLALALLTPRAARANGRFPAASHVVLGRGAAERMIVLRTTFGLVVSEDLGETFHWICEEMTVWPNVLPQTYDPPVELHRERAILIGNESGMNRMRNVCKVDPVPSARGRGIIDLASDGEASALFAIEATPGGVNHVLRSTDGGLTFSALGAGVSGVLFTTLDVAPSRRARVYAAGRAEQDQSVRFYRSDDEGMTLERVETDFFGAQELWVSGVSPADPDTVFVRAVRGLGTMLLRSTDGGRHFSRIAESSGAMLGFAVSDDGRTVWYGAREGLWRSADGGDHFDRVSTTPVLCLRARGDALYVCSDWLTQGWALGRSMDQGSSIVPLVGFEDLDGPFACSENEPHTVCVDRWPSLLNGFVRERDGADAGRPDVVFPLRRDTGVDAPDVPAASPDVPARDAGRAMDAGARADAAVIAPASASCGCAVPGRGGGGGALAGLVGVCAIRRRCRRA